MGLGNSRQAGSRCRVSLLGALGPRDPTSCYPVQPQGHWDFTSSSPSRAAFTLSVSYRLAAGNISPTKRGQERLGVGVTLVTEQKPPARVAGGDLKRAPASEHAAHLLLPLEGPTSLDPTHRHDDETSPLKQAPHWGRPPLVECSVELPVQSIKSSLLAACEGRPHSPPHSGPSPLTKPGLRLELKEETANMLCLEAALHISPKNKTIIFGREEDQLQA